LQDAPVYHFDPHLGSPRDRYSRADVVHPEARQPELPGRFAAYVEGETMINTMHGRRAVKWRVEPGSPCIILGYWDDGTIHLRWAAIRGGYRIDGRFPGWVAVRDLDAKMAGGGRVLQANNPIVPIRRLSARPILAAALLLIAVLVLFFLLHLGR
jgi:hypothetical protein